VDASDSRPRGFSVLREGSIPTEIGKLTNLAVLNLHDNQLSGRGDGVGQQLLVPLQPSVYIMCRLPQATMVIHFDAFGAFRAGSIPTEIGQLISLETLELKNNQLSGRCDRVEQRFDYQSTEYIL